jgi:DNA-binding SARP family transcriptional activator
VAELLEIAAHGVTAILATWLGLLVLTRARSVRGSRVFGFLCLLLVLWSVAIIIQRGGHDSSVKPGLNVIEDVAAFLLPAATQHIALTVTIEGRRSRSATALLLAAYLVGGVAALQAAIDPTHPIGFQPPFWEPFGMPGAIVGWGFVTLRAFIFAAAIAYLLSGLGRAGHDAARRRQLLAALLTVAVGAAGGVARILPEPLGGPPWVGVSLVAAAAVLASYAILAQHLFVAADVAGRALRWSVLAGLALVAYIALIVGLEAFATSVLGIEPPLVTALAIVVTLALIGPIADRAGGLFAGDAQFTDELRLLQALGSDSIVVQRPDEAVGPALERITRTFELAGAAVIDGGGEVRARVGEIDLDRPAGLRLPLTTGREIEGYAIFAPALDGSGFTPSQLHALRLAASFLASTLKLADRQSSQLLALAGLRAERRAVETRGSELEDALTDPSDADGLHVHALGSFRVEARGTPIRRWGGEKAGSRQAEAVFAFLFDRGDRGVAKDEILEVVWPDVDLDRADVAFHRTLLGLRRRLREVAGIDAADGGVSYHNDRYRLAPEVVAWSDVAQFEAIAGSGASVNEAEQLRLLEEARSLYRGDYLDDVPFYGDSTPVEERRTALRAACVEMLLDLASWYADRGERRAAAACMRQAQSLDGEAGAAESARRLLADRGTA